jgi:hypothetical protein
MFEDKIAPLKVHFKLGCTVVEFSDRLEVYLKNLAGCVNITTKSSLRRTGNYKYKFFEFDDYDGYSDYFESRNFRVQRFFPETTRTKSAFLYRITERQRTPCNTKFSARPISLNVLLV